MEKFVALPDFVGLNGTSFFVILQIHAIHLQSLLADMTSVK